MSKALVIKGANFFANKVATVTLIDIIPCAGITISDETHAFTAIGATYQLSETVAPIDTTDTVVWSSTDENVVTVSNEGLATCVGVGTASIIATCGTESATCAITATITLNANTELLHINLRYIQGTDLANSRDYISASPEGTSGETTNASRSRIYASDDDTTGYYKFNVGVTALGYPIQIPANTSTITVNTSEFNNYPGVVLMDGNNLSSYKISNKGAKAVSDFISPSTDGNNLIYDISSYSGYNSFVFSLRTKNSSKSADMCTGDVTVTFG